MLNFMRTCLHNYLLSYLPTCLHMYLSTYLLSLLIYLTAYQPAGLSDCKFIVLPVYRPAGFSSHLLYLLPAFYLPAYLSPSLSTYTLINWHAFIIYLPSQSSANLYQPAYQLISTSLLSKALPSLVSTCLLTYLLYRNM